MLKTSLKSFIYSFSVSLLAIISVDRAFWYKEPSVEEPLNIKSKSIALFLKETKTSSLPIKKISLAILPELNRVIETPSSADSEPEIILADSSDDFVFPLEVVDSYKVEAEKILAVQEDVVLADVLYSPEKQVEEVKISAEAVYEPESIVPQFVPPTVAEDVNVSSNKIVQTQKNDVAKRSGEDIVLASARKEGILPIPLQVSKGGSEKKVQIGDSRQLNHVALNSEMVTIESMDKKAAEGAKESGKDKEWISLNDNPWVVAKSGGGAKNQIAVKEFAEKTGEEISRALNVDEDKVGVQVATETVKNLIIPIPDEIMKKDNLTPKLAYPSSSDDASKEKIIDAKIKLQEAKEQSLLTPIEEEVVLETPVPENVKDKAAENVSQVTNVEKVEVKEKAEDKKGTLLGAINSIFSSTKKTVSEAKEKAIAKAQAKKIFRKHLDRSKPVSIMPTEIRLSFQPNRAEISGQTLRWVQAFAAKAAEAPNINLEIRIDGTSSMALQQKRLNLLHNILTHKGVEYSKINTVFTSREPNSFILRTITVGNNSGGSKGEVNGKRQPQYIQW